VSKLAMIRQSIVFKLAKIKTHGEYPIQVNASTNKACKKVLDQLNFRLERNTKLLQH